jgi:hypothetical protein
MMTSSEPVSADGLAARLQKLFFKTGLYDKCDIMTSEALPVAPECVV